MSKELANQLSDSVFLLCQLCLVLVFRSDCAISSVSYTVYMLLRVLSGVSQEKIATYLQHLRAEPRYLLAQNVSTCLDPLEVCLHRQTVQDTVHMFQYSIPTEGKPVTNQKNSGIVLLCTVGEISI